MVSTEYESLEVSEDIRWERRIWAFQRFGRYALALFLLLAFLGFTGSGPLSNASASSPDDLLSVSYERIDRINAPSTFQISFEPDLVSGDELQIWISSDFMRQVQMNQITPEPESVEIGAARYVFTFAVTADADPAPISFQFRPERPGISRAHIGVVDGPEISLRKLMLP